jgi:hypothetical protein
MRALRRVLTVGTSSNRMLRLLLLVLTIVFIVVGDLSHLLFTYPFSVDLEIPLRAAQRWVEGGEPYLASAFTGPPGPTQPFLYPPYVLVLVAPLLALPKVLVQLAWFAVCLASSVFFVRRLALPPWTWLLVFAWPPFLEPLIGGNVQLVLIGCFAWIFWRATKAAPYEPDDRDVSDPAEPGVRLGLVAALSSSIKVSQPQAWLYLLRHRTAGAVIGALVVAGLAAASLLVTGIAIWFDWLEQLRRATNPEWELGGIAVSRLIHPVLGFVITALSFLAIVLFVPKRRAGAWVGMLAVVGSPSLHNFGTLFLIPAMLVVRREIALVAAMVMATTSYEGTWAGILLVSGAMVAGLRWPGLLEPDGAATGEVAAPGPALGGPSPTRAGRGTEGSG